MFRKSISCLLTVCLMLFALPALAQDTAQELLAFDNSAWLYNEEDDVYYQVGVAYCTSPAAPDYETLGIYVPGAYFDATANGDGTYTCTVNTTGAVGSFTAATAPLVMPVNTAGYSAQLAPTGYSSGISQFTAEGIIYVYAGCRGRSNGYDTEGNLLYDGGAPWGVTDLKAAVRYIRYNADVLPGNAQLVFTFGHSGGGAQSVLMGATGDSALYTPYLESIGAAMTSKDGEALSDAIYATMAWCPITSLDTANEAYEWNMGQYASDQTRAQGTFTEAFSKDLAEAYATYINSLGLETPSGIALTLEESAEGIYAAGTYYEYLLSVVENSLNNFLSDTTFPYTPGNSFKADGGFPGGDTQTRGKVMGDDLDGTLPDADFKMSLEGELPDGALQDGELPGGELQDGELPQMLDGAPAMRGGRGAMSMDAQESVTYETVQDYIDALNGEEPWIVYDAQTNTATISSMEAFVTHCKSASKSVGAFDDLNRSQAENALFGVGDQDALHFDDTMAALLIENAQTYATLTGWDTAYISAYSDDLSMLDCLGTAQSVRENMYNPMYYLSDAYEGYGTSNVATHWRIRTGITQGDTALTVEVNLALALSQYEGVEDVDFETVWNQGHTTAERTGEGTANFIKWVIEMCAA